MSSIRILNLGEVMDTLISLKSLQGYGILATDGEIGSVDDFFFDDETWNIRYLVANTGSWLLSRRVLLPTAVLIEPEEGTKLFLVDLTMDKVKHSPDIAWDLPVSRKEESQVYRYYDWSPYWSADMPAMYVPEIGPRDQNERDPAELESETHVRSARDTDGYSVFAAGEKTGHIDDFLLDGENWHILYVMVNLGKWLSGKKVLLPVHFIEQISWIGGSVRTGLQKECITHARAVEFSDHLNLREADELTEDYYGSRFTS